MKKNSLWFSCYVFLQIITIVHPDKITLRRDPFQKESRSMPEQLEKLLSKHAQIKPILNENWQRSSNENSKPIIEGN